MHLGLFFFKKNNVFLVVWTKKEKFWVFPWSYNHKKKRKNATPPLPVIKIEMKPWIRLHNNGMLISTHMDINIHTVA